MLIFKKRSYSGSSAGSPLFLTQLVHLIQKSVAARIIGQPLSEMSFDSFFVQECLEDKVPVIGVTAVFGTTQEGSVDDLVHLLELRDKVIRIFHHIRVFLGAK